MIAFFMTHPVYDDWQFDNISSAKLNDTLAVVALSKTKSIKISSIHYYTRWHRLPILPNKV